MIPVTPIAALTILLDVDSIVAIESTPETVIVFADHQRMMVSDDAEALVRRIARCRSARVARAADPAAVEDSTPAGDLPRIDGWGV